MSAGHHAARAHHDSAFNRSILLATKISKFLHDASMIVIILLQCHCWHLKFSCFFSGYVMYMMHKCVHIRWATVVVGLLLIVNIGNGTDIWILWLLYTRYHFYMHVYSRPNIFSVFFCFISFKNVRARISMQDSTMKTGTRDAACLPVETYTN